VALIVDQQTQIEITNIVFIYPTLLTKLLYKKFCIIWNFSVYSTKTIEIADTAGMVPNV
jgi:hypothetical protein